MKKILDKMFGNKKLSFIVPNAIALLMYLLFILFGRAEYKIDLMIETPIVSIIGFFGIYLVVFLQVKNPMCPEWFLNLVELLFAICLDSFAVIRIVSFVISGFQNFDIVICLGLITYSAISWAHSKRT